MRQTALFLWLVLFSTSVFSAAPSARQLIKNAIDQWRGKSSYIEMSMTIHRPDWQRKMKMVSWNKGEDKALVRFTYPAKDAGSATLKKGKEMWIFTPKLNRVIKLPGSMMAQSWMGSDFSYNNLAKSDQVINDYTHKIIKTESKGKHTVYTIESIPKESAAIVWGKEQLVIRDDFIMLSETFFDQDMIAVKQMRTLKIAPMGGRDYPVLMRMLDLSKKDHWTDVETTKADFNIRIPAYMFTRSNLQNPRKGR